MQRHPFWAAMLCVATAVLARSVIAAERVLPPLNTESTALVGGELLRQGELYHRSAIHLSEVIEFGKSREYALMPGYYFRTGEGDGWETYSPADSPDAGRVRKAPGSITLQGSFHFSNDGQTIGVITNFYQAVNTEARGITRTTRPSWSDESMQRSLVYGGKTGTRIRLSYREIWKNIIRPSSDVFVEFDLADSNIVELKGVRMQVIEATNERIRYRVTQGFDSKEK